MHKASRKLVRFALAKNENEEKLALAIRTRNKDWKHGVERKREVVRVGIVAWANKNTVFVERKREVVRVGIVVWANKNAVFVKRKQEVVRAGKERNRLYDR